MLRYSVVLAGGVIPGPFSVTETTPTELHESPLEPSCSSAVVHDNYTGTGTTPVTYLETDLLTTIEQLTENHLATLTQSQLDGIDQFHGGGARITARSPWVRFLWYLVARGRMQGRSVRSRCFPRNDGRIRMALALGDVIDAQHGDRPGRRVRAAGPAGPGPAGSR
jgi:hypothetical protein